MDELLPCPFCGHDSPEFERMGTRRQSCIVICGHCGARHESSDEDAESGTSWNRRAAVAAQPEAVGEPCDTKGCACRWDKEDIRVQTCERHQGWLEVVHEWAERAKEAERQLASAPTIQPTQPVQEREAFIAAAKRAGMEGVWLGDGHNHSDEHFIHEMHQQMFEGWMLRATISATPPAQAGDAGEPSDGERLDWYVGNEETTSLAVAKLELRKLNGDQPTLAEWREAIDAAIRATKDQP